MTASKTTIDFLDELRWRGLIAQTTDEAALREHLESGARAAYVGFDPTADSLTIGNLVPIMCLVHLARAGHTPVVVMGGGTGLIGDPSGKSAERQLLTEQVVADHVQAQRPIFERVFAGAGLAAPTIVNNLDWIKDLSFIEILRDIGKHFSVNAMIQKDSVRDRLHTRDQGISYTEFSYMILQAYDFLHLYRQQGVTIQMGGSDQWGNITAGLDLIRKASPDDEHEAFGLTAPLVTKADGGKFGKTESGAVWLSRPRTSPYEYYQFWLNASDEDVPKFLRLFTLLTRDEIEQLEREHAKNPGARVAHRALADHATTLLHGEAQTVLAQRAAKALFSGDLADLPADLLDEVFAGTPHTDHPTADLQGEGVDPVELLVETKLASSKRQAREFIANGSVRINGVVLTPDERLTVNHLLHNRLIAIRRGKKTWHLTRWA